MSEQRVELKVEVPDGWILTGEWRQPVTYDHFMSEPGSVSQWLDYNPAEDAYLIVRPVSEGEGLTTPTPGESLEGAK